MNFGSLGQFLEFKQLKNNLKSPHSVAAESGPWLQCMAWRPTMRSWPKGWLGHGLATWPSHRGGPRAARAPAWSPHTDRAWDGMVVRSPAARRRLASGKVLSKISRGHRGGAGQGGGGRGALERWADGEAVQTASGGSVQWRWGSSGGRR
jgi:hypothetical protein